MGFRLTPEQFFNCTNRDTNVPNGVACICRSELFNQ